MITNKRHEYISSSPLSKYHRKDFKTESELRGNSKISEKKAPKNDNRLPEYNFQANHFFWISSIPYLFLAADGTILFANKAGQELLQKNENDLQSLNIKFFIDSEFQYQIDNLISTTLLNNEKEVCEAELIVNDVRIPTRITATMLPDTFECVFEIVDLTSQHNENSYRTLMEEAYVGIFVADANGFYTWVNRYGCEMLGYSREELLKMNVRDLLLIDEIREKPLQLQEMLSGTPVTLERNMIHKDGSLVPVEIKGKILSDGRLQGIVRNLTEQKKTERALLESEITYKHAESIAHLGSWQMDIKTGKSKWSDEFFRICGFEPQSFEPTKALRYQVVHPDDRHLFEYAVQKAINEKNSYKLEKRVLRPNGEVRYVLSVGEVILDQNDEPKEIKGVFLDITDLKKIEISLKKSEEKYRKLLEFLPIGLIIKNKNDEVVYQNHKSNEILDPGINLSANYLNVLKNDETPMSPDEFPSVIAFNEDRTVENIEMGVVQSKGKTWLNVTAAPMPESEEVIIAFMDITEKNEREKQLHELSEKLQELNATKDKFFSIIAHDLKNPFNSILGFSELLVRNIEKYSQAEIGKFAGIIHETSKKTYNLLENLLLWSRSQTGKMEYFPEIFPLDMLINDTIEFVQPTAYKKQIKINSRSTGGIEVFVDKNMMDTVFRNILTNAIKFSYPNSEIDVNVYEEGNNAVVSFKDSGIGIEPENLSKLFRLDSKFSVTGTNNEKGTGLGLLISKEFVERNKGKIRVFSEIDKGTEFRIILPKAQS